MLLKLNDLNDAVKSLQRGLNKLGSMLLIDGQFGTGTRDAIADARITLNRPGPPDSADDTFQAAVVDVPDLFPPLTAAGVTFIARAEVSNASAYKRKYQTPCWPSENSGITIGIGYDCKFASRDQLQRDWAGAVPQEVLDRLAPVLLKTGSKELLAEVEDIVVPLTAAMTVFAKKSLGQCLTETRTSFPQVDALGPARRTALVSLVYNRGAALTDSPDRLEMRKIRDLLASGHPDDVADQFDAMTRLWDPAKLAGLIQRRHEEATLWRSGFAALRLE